MDGVTGLLARMVYGTGIRLREALSLRVKDLDFDRRVVIVREGKGGKDRRIMLPDGIRVALKEQLQYSRADQAWAWHCSHRPLYRPIRKPALFAGITCIQSGCSAH